MIDKTLIGEELPVEKNSLWHNQLLFSTEDLYFIRTGSIAALRVSKIF